MSSISVAALWRYPVKSMAGESLTQSAISMSGLDGDRAYAMVDGENRVGSAKLVKVFGGLLHWQAGFKGPAAAGQKPPVRLSHPDGRQIDSDAPDAAAAIAAAFGADVAFHAAPPPGLKLAFAPGTLGGLHAQTTEFPVSSASPENTFFDLAPLLIVAGATLRALAGSEGTDACIKRLRPNLVLEDPVASAFVENSWVGRRLAIGPEVVIKVMIACPRCVMPNLSRADLPPDPGFLRRVAQANTCDLGDFGHLPCAGSYATVEAGGMVRQGDSVRVLEDG